MHPVRAATTARGSRAGALARGRRPAAGAGVCSVAAEARGRRAGGLPVVSSRRRQPCFHCITASFMPSTQAARRSQRSWWEARQPGLRCGAMSAVRLALNSRGLAVQQAPWAPPGPGAQRPCKYVLTRWHTRRVLRPYRSPSSLAFIQNAVIAGGLCTSCVREGGEEDGRPVAWVVEYPDGR
jgi:hypothetical protein